MLFQFAVNATQISQFWTNFIIVLKWGGLALILLVPLYLIMRNFAYRVEALIYRKTANGLVPEPLRKLRYFRSNGFKKMEFLNPLMGGVKYDPIEPIASEYIHRPLSKWNAGLVHLIRYGDNGFIPFNPNQNNYGDLIIEPADVSHKNWYSQLQNEIMLKYVLKDWYQRWGHAVIPIITITIIVIITYLLMSKVSENTNIVADRFIGASQNIVSATGNVSQAVEMMTQFCNNALDIKKNLGIIGEAPPV